MNLQAEYLGRLDCSSTFFSVECATKVGTTATCASCGSHTMGGQFMFVHSECIPQSKQCATWLLVDQARACL